MYGVTSKKNKYSFWPNPSTGNKRPTKANAGIINQLRGRFLLKDTKENKCNEAQKKTKKQKILCDVTIPKPVLAITNTG
jgi:hypothetical protein